MKKEFEKTQNLQDKNNEDWLNALKKDYNKLQDLNNDFRKDDYCKSQLQNEDDFNYTISLVDSVAPDEKKNAEENIFALFNRAKINKDISDSLKLKITEYLATQEKQELNKQIEELKNENEEFKSVFREVSEDNSHISEQEVELYNSTNNKQNEVLKFDLLSLSIEEKKPLLKDTGEKKDKKQQPELSWPLEQIVNINNATTDGKEADVKIILYNIDSDEPQIAGDNANQDEDQTNS